MTLDEYEIMLTEAYLKGDQAALDDLKMCAQTKLHAEGDRTMWERWEQHRMLESLIQDWPEPLLRKDLTHEVMSALDGTFGKPVTNSNSLSDPELECLPLSSPKLSVNKGPAKKASVKNAPLTNSPVKNSSVNKAKVTKLDSFIITPPNQHQQFRRYISRIGFTMAVFVVGVSLGLAINQAVTSFFYGQAIVVDQPFHKATYDANMNQKSIDFSKAMKDANHASNMMLDQVLNNKTEIQVTTDKK